MVTDRWRQILSALGQRSKQVEGLLNSCRPYGVKGGALYLGFNGDFTKNKMEQDDNMNLAQQVLEQVLGVPVCIKCFVAGSRRGELPPDIDNDGIVAAALRDLGGEIVDIQ